MSWNYRLIEEPDGSVILAEVYYDDEGKIIGYAGGGATQPWLRWDSREDCDLDYMVKALQRPSIARADLPTGELPS